MARKIDKRLDDLENAAGAKGEGFMVLYRDPEGGGYYENSPYCPDPGKHYTEEEKEALTENKETVLIVNYVDDWRGSYGPNNDQGDPVPA